MTKNLPTFQTTRNLPNMEEETRTETMETSSRDTADDGSHLDDIRMPDVEDQGCDPDGPITVDEEGQPIDDGPPEQIGRDAFWVVFQTAFDMPGMMIRDLSAMGIQDDERQGARAASDATYALLEIYYPKALMPQSETIAHLMIAGPFFLGKAMVVREIFRAMRAKPVQQSNQGREDQQPQQTASRADDWYNQGQRPAA